MGEEGAGTVACRLLAFRKCLPKIQGALADAQSGQLKRPALVACLATPDPVCDFLVA